MKDLIAMENLVWNFYSLNFIQSMADWMDRLHPDANCLESHIRFHEDIDKYEKMYSQKFAELLYDYMVFAITGEIRHAKQFGEFCIFPYFHTELELGSEIIRERIHRVDPENILYWGKKVFSCKWEGGYGGFRWAKACEIASTYGKVPNNVFIDSIVDLEHNNGSILDKVYFTWVDDGFWLDEVIKEKVHMKLNYMVEMGFMWSRDVRNLVLRFIHLYNNWLPKAEKLTASGETELKNSMKTSKNTIKEVNWDIKELMEYEPVEYRKLKHYLITPEQFVKRVEVENYLDAFYNNI